MSETSSQDEAIVQFCGITGADEERARGLLEACQWNLELAINTHVDCDPEGRSRQGAQSSGSSTGANAASSNNSNSNHRNFAVHIDDDDIDEGLDDSRGARFSSRPANPVSRRFNAATGSSSSAATPFDFYDRDSDGVRPPIAPVRQILNPNPIDYPGPEMPHARRYTTRTGSGIAEVVHDAFRDFQAEAHWHEMAQEGEANSTAPPESTRRSTIDELFRPPLELMFRGSLASARETGTTQNRWLLVNIQNGREFACQILNRDVWSNQAVRDIIKEHFIFWQVYHDSYEGSRYVQFYNAHKLPHVAIIDPRTGELMKLWRSSIDQTSFCDSVIEFLTEHPSPECSIDANPKVVSEEPTPIRTPESESKPTSTPAPTVPNQEEPKPEPTTLTTTVAEALKAAAAKKPVKVEGPECRIALRFPDGSSLVQTFSANEQLRSVKEFVQMVKNGFGNSKIEFVAPPNRKLTESKMFMTLEELGLCPASRLEVKCIED